MSNEYENEYEKATPLDWAKYELATVFCDFRIDPRAADTIERIVETLYMESTQQQLCRDVKMDVFNAVMKNKDKFQNGREAMNWVMREFKGHIHPAMVDDVITSIYCKNTLPKS